MVERRQASAPDSGKARRKPLLPWRAPHPFGAGGTARVCRRSASLLSAGGEPQRVAPQQLAVVRSGLDGSPIPVIARGEVNKIRCLTSLARKCARGNDEIYPPPLAGEGREGACGRSACASVERLPPLASLRSPPPPQAGEGSK